jgi:hypothetical protein
VLMARIHSAGEDSDPFSGEPAGLLPRRKSF